jgi:hypothetical protein
MRRTLVSLLLSLIASALIIGGIALVGKMSRDHVRRTIALSDIELNAPPDEKRDVFLAELQYAGGLEDEINLHEDGLAKRLADVFSRHPRVAGVERVLIGPGQRLHIELRYRVAVLAVPVRDAVRTVDGDGVLLPPNVAGTGLLVLRDTPLPPLVESGNTWADTRMLAASRTAAFLHGDEQQLNITAIAANEDGDVTVWTKGDRAIMWGKPPKDEQVDEPSANQKLARLRKHCQTYGDLDHPSGATQMDLRKGDGHSEK